MASVAASGPLVGTAAAASAATACSSTTEDGADVTGAALAGTFPFDEDPLLDAVLLDAPLEDGRPASCSSVVIACFEARSKTLVASVWPCCTANWPSIFAMPIWDRPFSTSFGN